MLNTRNDQKRRKESVRGKSAPWPDLDFLVPLVSCWGVGDYFKAMFMHTPCISNPFLTSGGILNRIKYSRATETLGTETLSYNSLTVADMVGWLIKQCSFPNSSLSASTRKTVKRTSSQTPLYVGMVMWYSSSQWGVNRSLLDCW